VKPFEPFLARWRALLESGPSAPRIAVAGAGAGGVEVAMAMQHALNRRGAGGTVVLFSEKNEFSSGLAARLRHALAALAIELRPATPAAPDESGFDAVFWLAGAAAPPLLRECGVKTDARGFVLVDACLRSVSHPDVFAAGDTASMLDTPVPKSGVYAVRQGAVLADNLGRALRGMPMLDYVPQKASLSLISCGRKYAIASRGGWSAEGAWAWHWKDWLDRRWIARFR
jgi:selenide,water dikinase